MIFLDFAPQQVLGDRAPAFRALLAHILLTLLYTLLAR